jgi:hypothetical protein
VDKTKCKKRRIVQVPEMTGSREVQCPGEAST